MLNAANGSSSHWVALVLSSCSMKEGVHAWVCGYACTLTLLIWVTVRLFVETLQAKSLRQARITQGKACMRLQVLQPWAKIVVQQSELSFCKACDSTDDEQHALLDWSSHDHVMQVSVLSVQTSAGDPALWWYWATLTDNLHPPCAQSNMQHIWCMISGPEVDRNCVQPAVAGCGHIHFIGPVFPE